MVRTKKHFRPPSPSSSSSSSEEEDDDAQLQQQQMIQRGRGKQLMSAAAPPMSNFSRGKSLGGMAGRGKQLRAQPESEEEEESSDDSDDDDDDDSSSSEEEAPAPPPVSQGKQLRPMGGRGKQLRAPSPPPQEEEDEEEESSSSEEEEDEEDEEEKLETQPPSEPAYRPPPAAVAAPMVANRGGGKQMPMPRGMGKQLQRHPAPAEEDSSSSSSDEEPWAQPRGRGKQLMRPSPAAPAASEKDESDMEESSEEEEEEEEEDKKEPEEPEQEPEPAPEPEPPKPPTPPPPIAKEEPEKEEPAPAKEPAAPEEKESEEEPEAADESEESEFEPDEPAGGRRGRPARAAAQKAAASNRAAAKKDISSEEEFKEEGEEEEEAEDDDGSDSESSSSSSEEEMEMELDVETYDMQKLVTGKDDERYLETLTELERENILAERFEKLKSEADMKKALRENKRREREQKKAAKKTKKKKPATKKRAAPSKAKKASPAKKKKAAKKIDSESESEGEEFEDEGEDGDESEDEEAPDVSGDVALAQSLAGKRVSSRNMDKKGKQFKKQAALAKIRENRANKSTTVESDSDYGRDSDDSDDDYEDEMKPWQQKGKKNTQLAESSDDESMGVEDEQEKSGQVEMRTDTDAGLEDYIKVSIPRRRLMRWCNEPFFENAVKNFYVRLGIGRDNKTQKACYRLCQITGIVIKSEYKFPPVDNRKPISTDKWLKVSFGHFVREFKMITVSDHRPSPEDVTQLVSQLRTERLTDSLLTKKSANKLRKRQDELVNNYTYTKEDIEMLVSETRKRNKRVQNIGVEKTRIAIAVQAAQDEVEEAKKRLQDLKVERMEADDNMSGAAEDGVIKAKKALKMATEKLKEKLEEQERIHKDESLRNSRLKQNSKVQNWAKVNQRAKMMNRNADFQAFKEEQARQKTQGEPKFDPYARRRQKPKNLWEVGGPKQQPDDKSSDAAGIEEEKKETSPSDRDDSNVGKDKGDKESNKREDITDPQKLEPPGQANNKFAFDDDFDTANLGAIGAKKKVRTRTRKGISLEEYQERKAAGTL